MNNGAKTECPSGHAYVAENTYVGPTGKRNCRTCRRRKSSARDRQDRAVRITWIDAQKLERGCVDCGYDAAAIALDFDHIPERGEKLFGISNNPKASPSKLKAEIAKCEVVCSNCHRIRTKDRRDATVSG